MCYSTTLDRELKAVERALNRRMIDELRRVDLPHQVELPLGQTSAFARPAWPVIASREPQRIGLLRWGLLPRSIQSEDEARDFLKKAPTFNAVSEEAATKRTFKHAFESGQRCLIPVTAFFEWRHEGKRKVPHRIGMKGEDIFCLGGLWEQSGTMDTYTVLTTRANELMAHIHNSKKRQPVIIPREQWEEWLSPALAPEGVKALCEPLPADRMEAVMVGDPPVQGTLF